MALFADYWLAALGRFLVSAEPPRKAEAIVVLAGDWRGRRILRAAELAREGYAPVVLVSGPKHHYGLYEHELAIPFAVRHGHPQSLFVPISITGANSTREEAVVILNEVRRRGIRSILVVTSSYHTRRSARIYRQLAGDLEFHVVSAPDAVFHPDRWWRSREARKTFLLEWTKLVTSLVGM
jgi:uncharacterized SAM-binding protein YcdF (DUF218 family)